MGVDAMGAIGKVTVAIRGADGPGEVTLAVGGVRESYIADSDYPIARGVTVLVIGTAKHRHVTVVPWPRLPDVE